MVAGELRCQRRPHVAGLAVAVEQHDRGPLPPTRTWRVVLFVWIFLIWNAAGYENVSAAAETADGSAASSASAKARSVSYPVIGASLLHGFGALMPATAERSPPLSAAGATSLERNVPRFVGKCQPWYAIGCRTQRMTAW